MTEALPGTLAIAVFVISFARSELIAIAMRAVAQAQKAVAVIRSKTLSEDEKEKLVQGAALAQFALFGLLTIHSLGLFSAAFLPVLASHFFGLASIGSVGAWLAQTEIVLLSTLAACAGCYLARWIDRSK